MNGEGTGDATGTLRIISVRDSANTEELCVWFIEWQKAFDRVN